MMYHGELTNILVVVMLLILSSLSVFTNTWSVIEMKSDLGKSESDAGLWKTCMKITGPDGKVVPNPIPNSTKSLRDMYPFSKDYTCSDPQNAGYKSSTLTAIRVFSITGLVLLLFSVILIIAAPEHKGYFMISLMIGGICSIVASILWATDKDIQIPSDSPSNVTEHYGYSWYLSLISGIIAILFSLLVHFNVIA